MSQSHEFTPVAKKLRFRGDAMPTNSNFHTRVEDLRFEDEPIRRRRNSNTPNNNNDDGKVDDDEKQNEKPSIFDFFKVEMSRGYMLEHDEERYSARRQKIYSFVRIPRELERFMVYGIMQCADSFLYIHTFLPIRYVLALWGLLTRPIAGCFGLRRRKQRILTPAEVCELLKGTMWIGCTLLMIYIDTNRVYHIIKSQSIIKLYIFYNMLEVGDRLLSAFGQDTIDALFWTATEPKKEGGERFHLLAHVLFAFIYMIVHSFLIMFQATTLNVALNANNKSLLTILISNNFVELKGSVFKKFDKTNLFQLSCSDVRERFHIAVLLFIVTLQTMKEFDWSGDQFNIMLRDAALVILTEVIIDWIKHAFITRFNDLPENLYREYTTSLAYDMTQTRQKHAFSDHSDLVARRMGFIPFPLGVVLIKAIYSAVSFDNFAAFVLFTLTFVFVLGIRVCLTICALGKACELMQHHTEEKNNSAPSSMTNVPPIPLPTEPLNRNASTVHIVHANDAKASAPYASLRQRLNVDKATSPTHPSTSSGSITLQSIQRDMQISPGGNQDPSSSFGMSMTSSTPSTHYKYTAHNPAKPSATKEMELDVTNSLDLGATALFSNSDVDLDDVRLNEHVLDTSPTNGNNLVLDEELARSEPDLQQKSTDSDSDIAGNVQNTANCNATQMQEQRKRTHKRSESEPSIQNALNDVDLHA